MVLTLKTTTVIYIYNHIYINIYSTTLYWQQHGNILFDIALNLYCNRNCIRVCPNDRDARNIQLFLSGKTSLTFDLDKSLAPLWDLCHCHVHPQRCGVRKLKYTPQMNGYGRMNNSPADFFWDLNFGQNRYTTEFAHTSHRNAFPVSLST